MSPGRRRSAAAEQRGRLLVVLSITSGVLVAEVVAGIVSGSLALLADAGHVLTDVAGLGMSLLAIWLAGRPPRPDRTFGLYRAEILAAVANGILLFGVAVAVLIEAWRRFRAPPPVAGGLMLVVALVGLAANAVSLGILHRRRAESLNVRAAYLEVLGDLLGSLAVVVAAVVIRTTGLWIADPIASAAIGVMILPRTWRLLKEGVDVLLEATPKDVDLEEVRRHILETSGVADAHDLHVWCLTSGVNVVSAHVVLAPGAESGPVLDRLCACLAGDFDIEHSTFQLESHDRTRIEDTGHR